LDPPGPSFAGAFSTAKVSNKVSTGSCYLAADQRLRRCAPHRDPLRLCDTTYWCWWRPATAVKAEAFLRAASAF